MPDDTFDPYHKWFGIPAAEQPADHYRLLGVNRFEDDADVIENSADARMASLQSRRTGAHSLLAEQLMNEVTQARICLLHQEKKAAYDQKLREEAESKPAKEEPVITAAPEVPTQQPSLQPLPPASQDLFDSAGFGQMPQAQMPDPGGASAFHGGSGYVSPANGYRPRKKRGLMPMLVVTGVAGLTVLLVVGGLVAFLLNQSEPPVPAISKGKLLLAIPTEIRPEVSLLLDGKPVTLPAAGSIELPCSSGPHRVEAKRYGYRDAVSQVDIAAGGMATINFAWEPASSMRFIWAAEERTGAALTIDGKDIDFRSAKSDASSMTFAVEPGVHEVAIARPNHSFFVESVTTIPGEVTDITPAWPPVSDPSADAPSPDDPAGPLADLPTGDPPESSVSNQDAAIVKNGDGSLDIDLLAMLQPDRHTWSGEWTVNENLLTMKRGWVPGMLLPYELPENYQLEIGVRRVSTIESWFMVVLPTRHGFVGVRNIKEGVAIDAHVAGGAVAKRKLSWDSRRHLMTYRMNNGQLSVDLDGRPMINWRVSPSNLKNDVRYEHNPRNIPSLRVSNNGLYEIDSIRLTIPAGAAQGRVADVDTRQHLVFRGHSYRRLTQQRDWRDAVKECEALGGYLCRVETREELQFLKENFQVFPGVWLGASDAAREGDWRWLNGRLVDESIWSEGQPDNSYGRESYLHLTQAISDLNDLRGMESCFVCEWDSPQPTPPEPGAISALDHIVHVPDPGTATKPLEHNGHTYCLINSATTWHLAQEFCRSMGGYLCCLETQDEHNYISGTLRVNRAGHYKAWTGATFSSGEWQWVSGAPFGFSFWREKPLFDPANRSILIDEGGRRHWVAINNCFRQVFICEWNTLNPPGLAKWLRGDDLSRNTKLKTPADAELQAASTAIAAKYNIDAVKSSREASLALAAVMFDAAETEADNAMRFSLYRKVYEISARHHAAWIGVRAIERLQRDFEFAESVTEKAQMLAYATQDIQDEWERTFILRYAPRLLKLSRTAEDFAGVKALYQHLAIQSRGAKDPELMKKVSALQDQVDGARQLKLEADAALTTLETRPGEPVASFKRGLYLGVVQADWHKALPLLARHQGIHLGKNAAELESKGDSFSKPTPDLDKKMGESLVELAASQSGIAAKSKAAVLREAAKFWFRRAHLSGGVGHREAVAAALGLEHQSLPRRAFGLAANGVGGEQEVAPVRVDHGGARGTKEVYARFTGKSEIEYPVLKSPHFTHAMLLDFQRPGGRINFMYHRGEDGVQLSVIGDRNSNTFRCELHRYIGSSYKLEGKLNLKVRPGHRIALDMVCRPGKASLVYLGKVVLEIRATDGDCQLQISVADGSQLTLHKSFLRPHMPIDRKRIGGFPRNILTVDGNWAMDAIINHRRNAGLATQPDAGQHSLFVLPSTGAAFVPIKSGQFKWQFDRKYQDVQIPDNYWIARNEVTQREWTAVLGSNPSRSHGSPWLPVDGISRSDAKAYCKALTKIEADAGRLPQGYVYRLPTEAEWTYAGRGGDTNLSPMTEQQVHCMPSSRHRPRACGVGVPNAWGLFDMQGNAGEWTLDAFVASRAPGTISPYAKPDAQTDEFVVCGGSWWQSYDHCHLWRRRRWPDVATYGIGLRPVLAPEK